MGRSDLMDAFLRLEDLAQSQPSVINPPQPRIARLVTEILKGLAAKPLQPTEEVKIKWAKAKELKDYSQITRSDIRSLFWEPDIVLSDEFYWVLTQRRLSIRTNSLKGVVSSVAAKWREFENSDNKLRFIFNKFNDITESDYLAEVGPYVFERSGCARLAAEVAHRQIKPGDLITEKFGVSLGATDYGFEILAEVATKHFQLAVSQNATERQWFYEEILKWLPKSEVLKSLGLIVADSRVHSNELVKEDLKAFILNHPNFGDPRLPGFDSNWDPNNPVTIAVIEWLSQSDVTFFFEWCYQNSNDHQGRKNFWLAYAHLIRGTRVVLTDDDRARYFREMKGRKDKRINERIIAYFGRSDGPATAFIMDFGSLKVVEFSQPNHACYFYDPRSSVRYNDRQVFWSVDKFSIDELKEQEKASERLSHSPGWEVRFANYLSRFGLRPKSPRRDPWRK
jgi:hypothetical protein